MSNKNKKEQFKKKDLSQSKGKIWNIQMTKEQQQKLITWTIEGIIIGIISFLILWLPLFK